MRADGRHAIRPRSSPRWRRWARAIARVRAAIGRVIFGQDEVVDQTLITLLSGGHVLLVGVPGLGKSRLVETLGVVLGPGHQARAVHPRPDAGRHPRQRGAGRGRRPPQLPLRARPGVLPVADGRRDQPRQPAHPVGAAAGDAGAARGGRRRRASRCRGRSTCWRRRTRSSRRAPIRCPRRSSTGSCWRSIVGYPDLDAERTMLLATTGAAEAPAGAGDDGRGTARGAGADPPRAGRREGGGGDPVAGARRPAGDSRRRDGAPPRRLGSRSARRAGADAGLAARARCWAAGWRPASTMWWRWRARCCATAWR